MTGRASKAFFTGEWSTDGEDDSYNCEHHGRRYALIQPITERDLEELGWSRLAENRLRKAWEREEDALYDYL